MSVQKTIICPICGAKKDIQIGHYNRSVRDGLNIYCGKKCSGIGGRKHKTAEEKKEDKRIYDAQRRALLGKELLIKKREAYKRDYDPKRAAEYRKKRMPYHVEYCRRPEYKETKSVYDRQYRAKKYCGEYWEAFLLAIDIRKYVVEKCGGDYEVRYAKGRYGRSQKAKREFAAAKRRFLEVGPMVSLERGQRR